MFSAFSLRKIGRQGRIFSVRRSILFPPVRHVGQASSAPASVGLRHGGEPARNSVRSHPIPSPTARDEGESTGRRAPGGEKVFAASRCAGWDGAETLRAPAASVRRGPQGKATVEPIVAGFSGSPLANLKDSAFPRVRALRSVAKALRRVGGLERAKKQIPQEHEQHGRKSSGNGQ